MKILINTETGRPDNEVAQTRERLDSMDADIASGKLVWVEYEPGSDISQLLFDPKTNTMKDDPAKKSARDTLIAQIKAIDSVTTLAQLKVVLKALITKIGADK